MLAMIAGSAAVLIMLGRRRRGTPVQSRYESALGNTGLILWIIINGWWMLPSHFDPAGSWPLQLCDLTALIAALVLLTGWRPLRALLYFWGFGLNTQGLITPLVRAGPIHIEFWFFWISHAMIIIAALHDLIVNRFRPRWRDCLLAIAASAAYLAIVLPIDIAWDLNYGYVGNKQPKGPTIIDALGPWPLRIEVIALLVIITMVLLMLPWQLARGRAVRGDTGQNGDAKRLES